ncbi:required for drug-induced death protein 1 [Myotis daubentonii]|uniref:required for drug-induced death protein 1 n=1 Tax=Myotis daubentonii TaxID=98922 RepID=UPI0028735579|nr:required for drug-induced death protein 1 [Myotis daubentonii]
MTVGARLRGRRGRGRGRRAGDEEPILEQLELGDSAAESTARPGTQRSARRVHLAVLPERYEPLEEPVAPVPEDKPKRRYRQKLKKYGKNVGKAIAKGCHYVVIGLQGFAAAYSAPFAVSTTMASVVR